MSHALPGYLPNTLWIILLCKLCKRASCLYFPSGRRCDNLFKDLDSRDLTEAEETIIAQRVALQQKMLEEYEKREKARKAGSTLQVVASQELQHL